MIVKVQVTQDDIDTGIGGNCHACPVAQAIQRTLGGIYVSAGPLDMSLNNYVIDTPGVAADFMARFDVGRTVWPFEFDLDVPDDLVPEEQASA